MKKQLYFLGLSLCLLFVSYHARAQNNFWREVKDNKELPLRQLRHNTLEHYRVYQLDEQGLRSYLTAAPLEFHNNGATLPLTLPLPDGKVETFGIVESPILSAEMAALYPSIKTYTGNGLEHKNYAIRFSLTDYGFNAILLNVESSVGGDAVYFDYYSPNTTARNSYYINYFASDATVNPKKSYGHCGVDHQHQGSGSGGFSLPTNLGTAKNNTGTTLRTYRIAIAGTGEFTGNYGGTANSAYTTGVVPYINRLTAVYRNEFAISFTLVSGESLVYTNAATDPYDVDSGTMLNQNQTNLNNVIGTANYDIGHVLSKSSGSGEGLAAASSACDASSKAQGVTKDGDIASYAQVFFDQAFFHEVGHQFSASHSYNGSAGVCTTREAATAVEPGGGMTIMSYGYTCDTHDLDSSTVNTPKNGPGLFFHTTNYTQVATYITTGNGNTCGTSTATSNNIPVVADLTNYTIPFSTPFSLTGTATDGDADALNYRWEGTNAGLAAGAPNNGNNGPFFRDYYPKTTATRTFPILAAILNGTNSAVGDYLPSAAKALTLRLTAMDNRTGGGGTAYKEATITVDGNAGPFLLTNDFNGTLQGNSTQTVTWSVNNTNSGAVNCANVKISLSTDGGQTFPTVLLANTPNDGSETITLPNVATTTARIKVEAVGNVFFDISNTNFAIQTVLAVELKDFTVKAQGKKRALLNWSTVSEQNNYGFEVEILSIAEGGAFRKLGFIKGNGTSATEHDYQFVTTDLQTGIYHFRLKQLDIDGKISYSGVRSIEIKDGVAIALYPNPAKEMVNIDIKLESSANVTVTLYNQLGQANQVILPKQYLDAGTYNFAIPTNNLANGVYFYELNVNGTTSQGKLMINK